MKRLNNKLSSLIALFIASAFFVACDTETTEDEIAEIRDERTIAQHFRENSEYNLLYRALEAADLLSALESDEKDQLTIFAPNNDAMAAFLSANGITDLEGVDQAMLANLLNYHLLGSEMSADNLMRENPTQLTNEVLYSVLDGTNINGISGVVGSSFLKNGVVHEVDRVLEFPSGNLMDEIDARSEFTLFQAAIDHAGLRDVLASASELTVFAPTDEAFAAAGLPTEGDITGLPQEVVADILNYHILESINFSVEVSSGRYFTLLGPEGTTRGIDVDADGGLVINGAYVPSAVETSSDYYQLNNILTDNGVIHAVDAVILPVPTALEVLDPSDLYYSSAETLFEDFYDALIRLQYDDSVVNELETNFTYLAPRADEWDQGSFTDEEIKQIIDNHLFDGIVSLSGAVDSKITSRSGAEYFVTSNAEGLFINGSVNSLVDFPGYNGAEHLLSDVLTPLPAEGITELMLASADYSLMGAALEKTEQIGDGAYTIFAVDNGVFTGLTGISDVADIEALDPEDADDAELIAALAELFANHIVERVEFAVDIFYDLPVITYLSGEEIPTINNSGEILIQVDAEVIANNPIVTTPDVILANNGVVHEVDGRIVP